VLRVAAAVLEEHLEVASARRLAEERLEPPLSEPAAAMEVLELGGAEGGHRALVARDEEARPSRSLVDDPRESPLEVGTRI
jgi:hypothetical protein